MRAEQKMNTRNNNIDIIQYSTTQLNNIFTDHNTHTTGQLSLAFLRVAKSSTSFGWVKGGKVTASGWQVLCDPI